MFDLGARVGALDEPGIESVPQRDRVLSGLDLAILWGDLGIGLLVLVTGALLVPALGFGDALAAIVLGSIAGVALLGLAAAAGADAGRPTMVLFRPVLGVRGSWAPSVLNAVQLVGWTAVELWAMSYVADLVARDVFGFSARWAWLLTAALICAGLALWGPVGVARVWMKRFGAWVIAAIGVAVTVLALTSEDVGAALTAPGSGGWPTFGPALDLVIAMPISWLPLVADYTRFARRPRSAFLGTAVGYLVANVWLYALGALIVLSTGAAPDPTGVAAGILALAGGSVAGVLFLVGLLVGETDEAFADIYSGAVTLQNIWPRASHGALVVAITALGTALAAWLTMARYETFLFLIGSVFVPLFGVLAAHYVDGGFRRAHHRSGRDLNDLGAAGVRVRALIPWVAGFAAYHWIAPTGPAWWTDPVRAAIGTPISEALPWLPASLPAFAVSFLIAVVIGRRVA